MKAVKFYRNPEDSKYSKLVLLYKIENGMLYCFSPYWRRNEWDFGTPIADLDKEWFSSLKEIPQEEAFLELLNK